MATSLKSNLEPLIVILGFVGLYAFLLHQSGRVGNAFREHAALDKWSAFNAGYRAALDDTETRRPLTEKTRRESVERAFRRTYVERGKR